ncbi:MAG: OmpA family protein [Gemmatimonadota bacterium]
MRTRLFIVTVMAVAIPTFAVPTNAAAQLRQLRQAATRAVESEAAKQIDRLLREAIRCAINDPICPREAGDDDVIFTDENGDVIVDEDGGPITERQKAADQAGVNLSDEQEADGDLARPGEGAWANYDFIPGKEVLFFEDYETDRVGDFPRRMGFISGNWDIVEWQGRRLFRTTGPRGAAFKINLPRTLPERFTIEVELYLGGLNQTLVISTSPPVAGRSWQTIQGNVVQVSARQGTGIEHASKSGVRSTQRFDPVAEGLVPLRFMVDGSYAKVYMGEQRVANIPTVEFSRTNEIYFIATYSPSEREAIYIGEIRVAGGGRDLYEDLAADGRVSTQGILFAVNSAQLRPESTPTLKEIGIMLQDHADLRIRIEGHTDSTGEEDYNQTLSDRRADSVRRFLIETYGIEADRLESQGFGESTPVDSNDTPEGRQNNRRVELVRLDG